MPFGDQAIGFFLQLDDQMSPKLKKAGTNYKKFTDQMEASNKRAFKSSSKLFTDLGGMADAFGQNVAKNAGRGYASALKEIEKKAAKPITQRVNFVIAAETERKLTTMMKKSVGEALGRAKLVLTAKKPTRRNPLFDRSVSLSQAYGQMTQPPDLAGMMRNLPRFQTGGEVPPPSPGTPRGAGRDKTLILAEPGELVISKQALGKISSMPKQFRDTFKSLRLVTEELSVLQSEVKLGLDPKAPDRFNAKLMEVEEVSSMLGREYGELETKLKKRILPQMEDMHDVVRDLKRPLHSTADDIERIGDEAQEVKNTSLSFLGVSEALEHVQDGVRGLFQASGQFLDTAEAGTGTLDSMADGLFEVGRNMGKTRVEAVKFGRELITTDNRYGNLISASEQIESAGVLREFGAGEEFIRRHNSDLAATAKIGLNVAEQMYQMGDALKFTREESIATALATRNLGASTALGLEGAQQALAEIIDPTSATGLALKQLPERMRSSMVQGLVGVRAAFGEEFLDLGKDLTEKIALSLEDSEAGIAARQSLRTLTDLDPQQIQKMVQEGNIEDVVRAMADKANRLGIKGLAAEGFAEIAQVDPTAFRSFTERQEETIDTAGKVRDSLVETTGAAEKLEKAVAGQVPVWSEWTNAAQRFVADKVGFDVIEALDGMNFQMIASAFYLGQMAKGAVVFAARATGAMLPALGGAIKKLFMFQRAAKGAAVSSVAGAGARGGGLGAMFAGVAKGLAAFAAPPVILGTAVITGAIIGLGFAAKVAAPAFEVILNGMQGIVAVFQEMDPGQIVASTAALALLGPSLAAIGTGTAVMATGMLVAAPAMIAFSAAMEKFGGVTGVGSTMSDVVMGLIAGFDVDQRQLDKSLGVIKSAAVFMGAFAAISTGALVGVAVSTVVNGVDKITSLFGGRSPFDQLTDFAGRITGVINNLATEFDPSKVAVDGLQTANKVFAGMGNFMAKFARTAALVAGIGLGASVMGAIDTSVEFWTGRDMASHIVKNGRDIRRSVTGLSDTFRALDSTATYKGFDSTIKVFEASGELFLAFEEVSDAFDRADPGAIKEMLSTAGDFWSDSTATGRIVAVGKDIAATAPKLATIFGPISGKDTADAFGTTVQAFRTTGAFLRNFTRLRELFDDVDPGVWAAVANKFATIFGGEETPGKRIAAGGADMVTAINEIVTTFAALNTDALTSTAEKFSPTGQFLSSLGLLMQGFNDLEPIANKLGNTEWLFGMFGDEGSIEPVLAQSDNIRDAMEKLSETFRGMRISARATARLASAGDMMSSLGGIVRGFRALDNIDFDAMNDRERERMRGKLQFVMETMAAIGFDIPTADDFQAAGLANVPSGSEIRSLIEVVVGENSPLVKQQQETNRLLGNIATLLKSSGQGTIQIQQAPQGATLPRPGPDTRNIAGGS